jgi:hypothetical protein
MLVCLIRDKEHPEKIYGKTILKHACFENSKVENN